jgi:hypothetical protein
MALKADRIEKETDISYFMNEVAERGGVVTLSGNGGSGAAMDQGVNLVTYLANPSGNFRQVGVLLNDVVNIDLTRQHLNQYKNEVQRGSKVTLLRKGYVVTNMIQGTPTSHSSAFVGHSGNFSAVSLSGHNGVVGEFMTRRDQDGFAKVEVNFPVTRTNG